jgi:hypothetical protein
MRRPCPNGGLLCHGEKTQVYYDIIEPIFDSQKYCYVFRLPSVAILSELEFSEIHRASLCGLPTVKDKTEHPCMDHTLGIDV